MEQNLMRGEQDSAICHQTQVRREACACGTCASGSCPEQKHRVNERDALRLLGFIACCIYNRPSQDLDCPCWADVGSIARIRAELLQMASGFMRGRDDSEVAARFERALGADDEEVDDALMSLAL